MDCSPPGSSVHGILLANILEWVAISSSFLCGTIIYLYFPTNWMGTCNLVYLAPDMSIAPNTQTLPIPRTHNWPRWAIKLTPLVISLGIAAGIGTGITGLTTSLNYYQSLSKDLTDSLEEIANSLVTIQNQLDSLTTMVLQNRRGLELLTAQKGGLEMGIADHLTCLLRNLHAGQEATVRTGHGKTDWIQIGKEVRQGCILSPCLFNLYAE